MSSTKPYRIVSIPETAKKTTKKKSGNKPVQMEDWKYIRLAEYYWCATHDGLNNPEVFGAYKAPTTDSGREEKASEGRAIVEYLTMTKDQNTQLHDAWETLNGLTPKQAKGLKNPRNTSEKVQIRRAIAGSHRKPFPGGIQSFLSQRETPRELGLPAKSTDEVGDLPSPPPRPNFSPGTPTVKTLKTKARNAMNTVLKAFTTPQNPGSSKMGEPLDVEDLDEDLDVPSILDYPPVASPLVLDLRPDPDYVEPDDFTEGKSFPRRPAPIPPKKKSTPSPTEIFLKEGENKEAPENKEIAPMSTTPSSDVMMKFKTDVESIIKEGGINKLSKLEQAKNIIRHMAKGMGWDLPLAEEWMANVQRDAERSLQNETSSSGESSSSSSSEATESLPANDGNDADLFGGDDLGDLGGIAGEQNASRVVLEDVTDESGASGDPGGDGGGLIPMPPPKGNHVPPQPTPSPPPAQSSAPQPVVPGTKTSMSTNTDPVPRPAPRYEGPYNAGQMLPRALQKENIKKDVVGDVLQNLPEPPPVNDVLRTEYTEADSRLLIPSEMDQLRSDIGFDMFSVVRPGFGLGADNKLFQYENIRDEKIIGHEPLFLPRPYDGPTCGVDTVPLLLQNQVPLSTLANNQKVNNKLQLSALITKESCRRGSLNVLGDDYGQLDSISDRGLNRPPESVFEPVIRIDSRWQRVKLEPGVLSSKRGFRHVYDSLRYPEHVTPHMNLDGGPTMKKARASLQVLI